MAIRTTDEAVRGIIDLDDDFDTTPHIEAASSIVDSTCILKSSYSDAQLELIERWLSAHFCAIQDPRATYDQTGAIMSSYESKVDLGLSLTRYGQQAMIIDTDGNLAALANAQKKVSTVLAVSKRTRFTWLGTASEETS